MIDLNRISVFVRVVEAGSFTAGARRMGMTVSSASRAVAQLEGELGVGLLQRTTRRLNLTDAGEHYFRRMQAVITEAEEASLAAQGFARDPRGTVRITAPHDLGGGKRFPDIVAAVARRHPGIVLELKLTNRFVDLVGEGIDLAIRAGVLSDSALMARKVAESDLGVFGAPAYLERRGQPRRPSDLVHHDCLSYGGRDGRLPWRLSGPGGEQTIATSGPVVCDDMIFLRDAAIAGIGLALIPVDIARIAVSAGRLTRVLPRYGHQGGGVYLVWPSQKLVPARVVAVREMLANELEELYAAAPPERAKGGRGP
jgi:DNA-binding transcriptional LysR family regulator